MALATKRALCCSFCRLGLAQVSFLVQGDAGAAICDRCSDIAHHEIQVQRAHGGKTLIERAVDKGGGI